MESPSSAGDASLRPGSPSTVDESARLQESGQSSQGLRTDTDPTVSAGMVADRTVIVWKTVDAALAPLIGRRSVTMLYRRCLTSVGTTCAWLPAVNEADSPTNDWSVLHAAVSRQAPAEAAAACGTLFFTFRDLLGSLIGPSLTEQLLQPVAALGFFGHAEQDILP